MSLFHFHVTQIKRSAGQSAVSCAAYRAGEKLKSEYYGEVSDYTRKGGVVESGIMLPEYVPQNLSDRETLWNEVEKIEKGKKAQLAYSFDFALQNEFTMDENIELAKKFIQEQFVERGMIADFAIHSPKTNGIANPHVHVMCPIRPIEENGEWGNKQKRVYELDLNGNRVTDHNGNYIFSAVPTTDWGKPETLEHWRSEWARMCNEKFEEKQLAERIDYRSYNRFLSICNADSFIAGFRLGARFTYDTLLKERIIAMTEITYTRNGDYFIPDIVLKEKERKPLGKYGRLRKDYLKNHRPALWNRYLLKDTLDDHLHEIDSKAQTRFDILLPLYCERYDVTEELKATDQMEWVRRMNNIINAIEEIILNEIVYR